MFPSIRRAAPLFAAAAGTAAQAAPAAAVHIRGAIASVQGKTMTVTSASGPVRV